MNVFQFKIIMRILLNIAKSVTRFPDEIKLIERDLYRYFQETD